jgi:hypothetical protein
MTDEEKERLMKELLERYNAVNAQADQIHDRNERQQFLLQAMAELETETGRVLRAIGAPELTESQKRDAKDNALDTLRVMATHGPDAASRLIRAPLDELQKMLRSKTPKT